MQGGEVGNVPSLIYGGGKAENLNFSFFPRFLSMKSLFSVIFSDFSAQFYKISGKMTTISTEEMTTILKTAQQGLSLLRDEHSTISRTLEAITSGKTV